ncbi:hypothetical protein [Thiomicrorhabdus sediminis]|uniref:Uncharacterized protein n=1 Tax=Thiomicrorhabdus sediminis TaxID=2580412 RepID=A0A4P9K449_9GAMM|nr:hypothetical protein [Thiomicrorhabdus sediminis]QCU89451.1 hypothetical protein FE785_01780 [Thiomicrorhabdus sediminis]
MRSKQQPITPAIKYFFKRLEKQAHQIERQVALEHERNQPVPFDEVENFFRQIMTQNIFIFTVGVNGKPESTILSKAIFSMNKVVRVFYSTSLNDDNNGFIRIRPINSEQRIVVERLHGHRPVPELLYSSKDQCHIVRFMVRWMMRRIDWSKTKLGNLDLYKRVLEEMHLELERKLMLIDEGEEAEALREEYRKHSKLLSKNHIKAPR